MIRKTFARVLALDLHPHRFGYVVVESPAKLLDWGVRSYRRKGNPADVLIRRRLRPLLELGKPMLLAIRDPQQLCPRQRRLREKLLRGIAKEAKAHRARVQMLKKRSTDRAEKLTKYERAQEVIKRFPVLTRNLPPKRKPWESEHYSVSMFEALAVAVTYVSKRRVPNWGALKGEHNKGPDR
jgi:hypothetical protein